MDDVLGDDIGRGGLGPEDHGQGTAGLVPGLDLLVLPDQVQGVHLLALVLVQALDLDVENGVGVRLYPGLLLQVPAQGLLVFVLDGHQVLQRLLILLEGQQLLKLCRVLLPAGADLLGDPLGQQGVAVDEPPPVGDAVCLVVELLRVDLGKGLELGGAEDLGVQGGHAVDREAVVDVHVGHVHQAVLIDDGHLGIVVLLLHPAVQLLDDGHQLGHRFLEVVHRPLLQSLRQDGVVGVGAGLAHLVDGLVQRDPSLGEQADELGDDHGGVGVVDLDHRVLGELTERLALVLQLLEDELGPGADHEVLLVHPQKPSGPVAVVGVEEQGEVVEDVALVEVDAVFHQGLVHPLQVEEVELVHAAFIAGDIQVVEHRPGLPLGEGHGEAHSGVLQPALGGEPGVRLLLLLVVPEVLVEQAEVVEKAHPVPGQAQGGAGVQIAGGQAPQAPVAQGGFRLRLFHGGQVLPRLLQRLFHLVVDPQVDQVVGEELAHQKLRGDIVELPLPLNPGGGGQLLLGQLQQGLVDLLVVRGQQPLREPQAHFLFQLIPHTHRSCLLSWGRGRRWWTAVPAFWPASSPPGPWSCATSS